MQSKHKSGQQKQKNKPFKGGSKRKNKDKQGKIIKKKISKQNNVPKPKLEIEKEKQPIAEKQVSPFEILKKQTKQTKIIAVIPFNNSSNTQSIRCFYRDLICQNLGIQQIPNTSYITQSIFLRVDPNKNSINQLFINLNSSFSKATIILDACKIADIMCPVLSCRESNIDGLVLDPIKNANAFDDFGYRTLSCLRQQVLRGLIPQCCLIQDLDAINQGKRPQVKKLFQRFFNSEFGDDAHISTIEGGNCLPWLRTLYGINPTSIEWRDCRGYMLPEDFHYNAELQQLTVIGLWKGQMGINANQLVHLTGIDDFELEMVELVTKNESMEEEIKQDETKRLLRDATKAESLDPICHKQEDQDIGGNILSQFENLDLGIDEQQQQKQPKNLQMQNEDDEDEEIHDQMSDVSYQEEEEENQKKKYELMKRQQEDLDFEDEVEYNVDEQLRERYKKYSGLKNFRNNYFDPMTFLPDEIDKFYNFRQLKKVKKTAIDEMNLEDRFPAGLYLKLVIRNFKQQDIVKITQQNRIQVISGLLKHERKLTQMHVRVRKHPNFEGQIKSKVPIEIHVGFRRTKLSPIFSRIYQNCGKTKYVKQFNDEGNYLASFYFLCTFAPANVLLFNSDFDYRNGVLMASGEVVKCEAFQVVLKRVQLTGYPFKINKRKAVVHMMFFNPNDIRYFQPIDLVTKLGLKGTILEPLGTHGNMKCVFNNYIKPNDTICLNLYKRVHPKFAFQ